MAKENKKKSGIPRLLELAGEKKTLMVWGCILSTANVFFQLVPFLAVYNIMAELLKNASDLTNADTGFMVSWAVKGIVGLLIGYVFMYFGGMLGHTAAYRSSTVFASVCLNISANCLLGGLIEMQSGKSSKLRNRM